MRGLLTSTLPPLRSLTLGGHHLFPITRCTLDHLWSQEKDVCLQERARCPGHKFSWLSLGFGSLCMALFVVVMSPHLGALAKAERYLTIPC